MAHTLTVHLESELPLQCENRCVNPTAQEARLLGIAGDEPCLAVVRRTVNHQHPITLARLVHPGQRYRLQGAFEP